MSESDKQYSKVEREVIEILDQLDLDGPKERPANVIDFRSRRSKPRIQEFSKLRSKLRRPRIDIPAVTPLRMFLFMAALAVLAYALRSYSSTIALLLAIASIVCLMSLFVIGGASRPSGTPRPPQTKRWRGQDIEIGQPNSPPQRRWPPFRRGPRP